MTFVHWMQGLWFVIVLTQCVQLYFVDRTRKKLKKQTEKLDAMVRTFERVNSTLNPYPNATINSNPQREEPRA
jgi:hypothetical protein